MEKEDSISFPKPGFCEGKKFLVPSEEIKNKIIGIFDIGLKNNCKDSFISVQMHGYLLKDKEGKFSEYVSWRDKSGNISDEKFKNVDFNRMGTSLKENLPLVKLINETGSGEFFTLGSYLSFILTGKNITHITDGCASGFFYSDSGKPNGYENGMTMPEIRKAVTCVGKYRGMTVYTPVGDHQSSVMGSGISNEKYLVNIGTATQISCIHNSNYKNGNYEKRPWFNDNLLYTVSGLVGGDCLYKGQGEEELLKQIAESLKKLPEKKEIVFGGGGAEKVFAYLSKKLSEAGYICSRAEKNIGMKGLEMLAEEKRLKLGTMLSEIRFPNFPVIAKNCGLDFIIIDNEHGCFDYSDIASLIMTSKLSGIEAIVRIGDSSRAHITKLADMGVTAFLLPMTNTAEDIKRVVEFSKYSPIGKRGVSTTRAHTLYDPPKLTEYMKNANEKMKVYSQIETLSGIENIDSIITTDGVDGIFIGPNDLSVDMNCISDKKPVLSAIKTISESVLSTGKPFGIITGDKELIDFSVKCDVGMISVGSELNMLINGCKKIKNDMEKAVDKNV